MDQGGGALEGRAAYERAQAELASIPLTVLGVDDEATKALMVKFYELWNPRDDSKGLGAAAALKEAQAFVRSQEKWKHPKYWAAWVLWGLPE